MLIYKEILGGVEIMIFFKPKTEEEKIEKELKSMERDFRFNKLSRKEVECLYFAKKNGIDLDSINKNTLKTIINISKMMADENISKEDILIAQNFTIISLLEALVNSKNK